MSRIGKKTILIPAGIEVTITGEQVTAKGPKGTMTRVMHPAMDIVKKDSEICVSPKTTSLLKARILNSLWGTTRTLVANMIHGVEKGYEKKLEIEGVGYRAAVQG